MNPKYRRAFWVGMIFSLPLLATAGPKISKAKIQIESTSFQNLGMIPDKYTCNGDNISPEIDWKKFPAKTKSFVLLCEDPDAPTQVWTHWVVFNIPADVYELTENFPTDGELRNGITQGTNDFKNLGYGGPCPSNGTHRYYFKVYALDCLLDLKAGALKSQVEGAMKGHILAFNQMVGLYGK